MLLAETSFAKNSYGANLLKIVAESQSFENCSAVDEVMDKNVMTSSDSFFVTLYFCQYLTFQVRHFVLRFLCLYIDIERHGV